jgi:CheY-like chemotaxis protein
MDTTKLFSKDYPLSILVAENDPDDRTTTQNMLNSLGYQPEVAVDDQQILRMTSKKDYDVILIDIRMPGMKGILAAHLGGQGDRRPLIVSMTGSNASLNFKQICLKVETDHFITRPVDLNELSLQLQAYCVLMGKCCIIPPAAASKAGPHYPRT